MKPLAVPGRWRVMTQPAVHEVSVQQAVVIVDPRPDALQCSSAEGEEPRSHRATIRFVAEEAVLPDCRHFLPATEHRGDA